MLHHPNICPVFDAGEIEDIPFLAMADLEGRPRSVLVEPGRPLDQRHAAGAGEQAMVGHPEAPAQVTGSPLIQDRTEYLLAGQDLAPTRKTPLAVPARNLYPVARLMPG
jgi:hypothetical protein